MISDNRHKINHFVIQLMACASIAFTARTLIAILCPGAWRPDEIFQYMEPAHKWAYNTGIMTWEWRAGIRSWFIPIFIAEIMKIGDLIGINDKIFLIRECFSFISLSVVISFFWYGWRRSGIYLAWTLGIAAALWPDLASGGIRPLGEFTAGNALAIAVVLLLACRNIENPPKYLLYGLSGFFLGLTISLRFQIAPAAVLAFLFLPQKNRAKYIVFSFICFLMPIVFLGILDKITLGSMFQSIFRNFYYNHTLGVADTFGIKWFGYYFEKYINFWGAMFVFLIIFSVKAKKEECIPLLVGVFVVFYHSLIPHKEVSFIYPAIPLIVLSSGLGFFRSFNGTQRSYFCTLVVLAFSMICIFISTYVPYLKDKFEGFYFERQILQNNNSCGIAMFSRKDGGDFPSIGYGYSLMNVPIYLYSKEKERDINSDKYNYLMTRDYNFIANHPSKWKLIGSEKDDGLYLYQRDGQCSDHPDFEQFSQKLKELNK